MDGQNYNSKDGASIAASRGKKIGACFTGRQTEHGKALNGQCIRASRYFSVHITLFVLLYGIVLNYKTTARMQQFTG